MKKVIFASLFLFVQTKYNFLFAQVLFAQKLIKSYPDFIIGFVNNKLKFKDGTYMVFDDGKNKQTEEKLNNPDIQDQFYYVYKMGEISKDIENGNDPGRIRNESFFKKMYGSSANEVKKHLTTIIWCPKTIGQQIKVTTINGVDKALLKVSDQLDKHPELKKYLTNIGGTFNWRFIAGTNRLSMHSFGMTVDINTTFTNYWQWECHCTNELSLVTYKNQIPQIIVDAFEQNGFIWGGKWYHFDTMHFEYRPELLNN